MNGVRLRCRKQHRVHKSDGLAEGREHLLDLAGHDSHLTPVTLSGLCPFEVLAVNHAEVVRGRMALLEGRRQKAPDTVLRYGYGKKISHLQPRPPDVLEGVAKLCQLTFGVFGRRSSFL